MRHANNNEPSPVRPREAPTAIGSVPGAVVSDADFSTVVGVSTAPQDVLGPRDSHHCEFEDHDWNADFHDVATTPPPSHDFGALPIPSAASHRYNLSVETSGAVSPEYMDSTPVDRPWREAVETQLNDAGGEGLSVELPTMGAISTVRWGRGNETTVAKGRGIARAIKHRPPEVTCPQSRGLCV